MQVKTCERGRVKYFNQRSRVYYTVRYNDFFHVDPDDRVIMESQCIQDTFTLLDDSIKVNPR